MKKILLLALFGTFSFGANFCYDQKQDTYSGEWKKIVQDVTLKGWIENQVKHKKSSCITITESSQITNAKEIIDSEPTTTFYFK